MDVNFIVAHDTDLLKSQIYEYLLYIHWNISAFFILRKYCVWLLLCSDRFWELLKFPFISKFRVDWWLNSHQKYKRQFPFIFKFRIGWLFYLSTLQKRVLTVSNRFPQFDNMECDGTKNGWKHSWKERDPNKLGTRNICKITEIMNS